MNSNTPGPGGNKDSLSPTDFARLGNITRELHEALHALGAMPELQRVVQEIPDARERLSYVGEMTEKAAHKVLNLVDAAQPICHQHAESARELAQSLAAAQASQALSLEEARRILTRCGGHATDSAGFAQSQGEVLSNIMLAQDFQDLSGQVIKKVIDMITRTERQLLQMLIDNPAAAAQAPAAAQVLEGPQTPEKALAQDDVDDLLASMGF
jgi:chemotaxis protein CheZ